MKKRQYDEMVESLDSLMTEMDLINKKIFVFGHCGASLELIDLLESKGLKTKGILDNSEAKQNEVYKNARVYYPAAINDVAGDNPKENSIVLITSRFYASATSLIAAG